jgi:hypothetical protein
MAVTSAASAELIAISSIVYAYPHRVPLSCWYADPVSCHIAPTSNKILSPIKNKTHSRNWLSCSIYRTYWKPKATGAEIVRVSHIVIFVWAIWMGCWAVILNKAGVNLGWVCHSSPSALSRFFKTF